MKEKNKMWKLFSNLILTLTSIVLVLFIFESVSYLYPYFDIIKHPYRIKYIDNKDMITGTSINIEERHPILGGRMGQSNITGNHKREVKYSPFLERTAFDVLIAHNNLGFRDYNHKHHHKSSTKILVLGDSNGWGWGCAQDSIFSYQLERILQQKGDPVEVVNISYPGWGFNHYLLAYDLFGKVYNPKIVILLICSNDPFDLYSAEIETRPAPVFKLNEINGDLIYPELPLPTQEQWNQFRKNSNPDLKKIKYFVYKPNLIQYPHKSHAEKEYFCKIKQDYKSSNIGVEPSHINHNETAVMRLKQFLFDNSLIYYKLSNLIHSFDWLEIIFVNIGIAHFNYNNNKGSSLYDDDVNSISKAVMNEIHKKVTSSGARLICLYIPKLNEVYGIDQDYYFRRMFKELEIENISLLSEFRKHFKKGEIPYIKYDRFRFDAHIGHAGHRIAAVLTAKYVEKSIE